MCHCVLVLWSDVPTTISSTVESKKGSFRGYLLNSPENARAILPFSAAAPVQATHVLSFYKISSPFLLISSTWTSPADLVETPRLG